VPRRASPSRISLTREPEAAASALPDKPYFKIGEAARLAGVKPFVLRYWETEFRSLRPEKTKSGQRLYRRRDVELVLRIRKLLHDERFTIEGARQRLRELGHDESPPPSPPPPAVEVETLRKIKQGLLDLLRLVED
jgi:DNA-binding transcriptional MerR regulator